MCLVLLYANKILIRESERKEFHTEAIMTNRSATISDMFFLIKAEDCRATVWDVSD